jgi:transketolase
VSAIATDIDQICINTIRGLSMDAVQKANSGHPGLPMGAAAMAYALWTKHLRHNPKNPHWFNRDRFILSAGHGSMLLYSLLFLTGYDLSLDDIKQFRQWRSKTPGHPENTHTPGVEMATGPLGQGFATSVGYAIAEKYLSSYFNRPGHDIIDHFTLGICSDGDLMEGITNEAASLAGHLKLGKIIFLYDNNHISLDGPTSDTFTEDVVARFRALDWHVIEVNGMDVKEVDDAITVAKLHTEAPTLISAETIIGFGSPNRQNTHLAHGEALGPDEVKLAKQTLGIPLEPDFYVPDEALKFYREAVPKGAEEEADWDKKFAAYATEFPELAKELRALIKGDFGQAWIDALPVIDDKIATRASSGKVLNAIAASLPTMIAGSADLSGSTIITIKDDGQFQADNPTGRTMAYGVREHAMIAAVNGINLHGACKAYSGTFLVFSDYCRGSIRLAAIMELPSIYVFTHDSIGLGEDGPTHQPIEHLMALRAIPNLDVFRPADGHETAVGWKVALQSKKTPTLMVLTRQAVPNLTPSDVKNHPAEKGAYVLREASSKAKCQVVGTGSEVSVAVEAAEALEKEGIPTRVISMPSWLLFSRQSEEYQKSVFPKGLPTVSVEAGTTLGWAKYAQAQVGIDHFGASAPGPLLMEKFGITAAHVVELAKGLLAE